jgi:hypothetical protein
VSNTAYWIIGGVVVVVGGYLLLRNNNPPAPTMEVGAPPQSTSWETVINSGIGAINNIVTGVREGDARRAAAESNRSTSGAAGALGGASGGANRSSS